VTTLVQYTRKLEWKW